jgi:mannose-6-phosphate isomerase
MAHHVTDRAGGVRTPKPWVFEHLWAITGRYAGKGIHVDRGHQLSLQRKEKTILPVREHWMEPGETYHIPAGRLHRMSAVEDCDILEASTPDLEHVVRVEDAYGRAAVPAGSGS